MHNINIACSDVVWMWQVHEFWKALVSGAVEAKGICK